MLAAVLALLTSLSQSKRPQTCERDTGASPWRSVDCLHQATSDVEEVPAREPLRISPLVVEDPEEPPLSLRLRIAGLEPWRSLTLQC
ncbi:hypothetical protein F2P81_006579 [Scophthalmus maximus]|uniref:Uncharacterized protein n=1 Tax=Scophthalmus maximus TaxID=52904 RepID=A0A6A4TCQ0_SCOMX|nr:hypothetical protein F2P81_006579 [Scophthalmus maximus]